MKIKIKHIKSEETLQMYGNNFLTQEQLDKIEVA